MTHGIVTERRSLAVPVRRDTGCERCIGKRFYPNRERALRGLKALRRDKGNQMAAPGALEVYRCDCGNWCVGHAVQHNRPAHRHMERICADDFVSDASLFANADLIAKQRFPNGANASQLAAILRELLAERTRLASLPTPGQVTA